MLSIVVHSGFGNQLFQWAYLNYLSSMNVSTRMTQLDVLKSSNRRVCIETLLNIQGLELCHSKGYAFRFANNFNGKFHPHSRCQSKSLNYSSRPFHYPSPEEVLGARTIFGYFQNVEMVNQVSEMMIPTIEAALEAVDLPREIRKLEDTQVIHIRRGDLAQEGNKLKYGVLDRDFYTSLPTQVQKGAIIVTDDLIYGEFVKESIGAKLVLGPESLDEWQTFKLMVNTSQLVSANSTFSWWAAYLRTKSRREVFIPNPFFRDTQFIVKGALTLPGAKMISSSFEPTT